ncbi:MAG: peptide chain release factor 1 [Candidatus Dependentiae bacterium]|nr:peptide chain release factor 1 [Candidatus Dependentiae bacterium]
MHKAMREQLQKRFDELSQELLSPSLDSSKRHRVQKELSYLSTVLSKLTHIEKIEQELADIKAQKTEQADTELLALFEEESQNLEMRLKFEQQELEELLYPPDELSSRSVFLEIRAGTGGQEAALFAADLMRMYMLYAQKKNWRVSVASVSETDLGGFREVILHIEGKNVYGHLKYESGVHRVQRVPSTETSGRIHTSTATVAVLPEAEEVELSINPQDLRIDVYRSGGAGGQHVNTTDSAVRITHIPTGLVVTCQDERSQHKNKAKALKVLQSRLLAQQQEKHEAEISQKRKQMVGTGERSEKVRTYNFPQNRVTDHQVNVTLNKLDMVMEGNLDEIIDALMERDKEERRKKPLAFLQT